MIAHQFPPAAGSGSNRALAFARYLPDYGWQPVVVTPATVWASPRDDGLLAEVPAALPVIRTRSLERRGVDPREPETSDVGATASRGQSQQPIAAPGGRRSTGVSRLVRSHVGHLKRFPDAHVGWLPFALAAGSRQRFDVAYSSSGPFTSHLIGLLLKRMCRRPWVAELRDGWYRWNRAVFPDYPAWRDGLEQRLEAAALRNADRVILVTTRMAEDFRTQYSDLPAQHFAVVPNGFDPRQFAHLPPDQASRAGFELLHSGSLYYGRGVAALLDAAERLCQRSAAFAQAFELTLLGSLDETARAEVRQHGLGERVRLAGQVDHATALTAMRSASALLLLANTTAGAEATVPGKLFEYLAAGKPVLAIAPAESSTADVLAETGGGWLASPDDPRAIACALERAFAEYRAGTARCADRLRLARYDRRALAGELSAIFEQAHARRA